MDDYCEYCNRGYCKLQGLLCHSDEDNPCIIPIAFGYKVINHPAKDINKLIMNKKVFEFVRKYVEEHLDKSDPKQKFEVFVVWQCYILGNAKWLLSTTLPDGMYYEVTYNKVKDEFYLDAYKKFENRCIPNK